MWTHLSDWPLFSRPVSNNCLSQYILSLQFLIITGWLMKLAAPLRWQLMKKLWRHALDLLTSKPMAPSSAVDALGVHSPVCNRWFSQRWPSTACGSCQWTNESISVTVWHTYGRRLEAGEMVLDFVTLILSGWIKKNEIVQMNSKPDLMRHSSYYNKLLFHLLLVVKVFFRK